MREDGRREGIGWVGNGKEAIGRFLVGIGWNWKFLEGMGGDG